VGEREDREREGKKKERGQNKRRKENGRNFTDKEGLSRPRHIGHPIRTTQGGQEAAEHMGTKFFVFVFFCF
jgi:hypothetical protein